MATFTGDTAALGSVLAADDPTWVDRRCIAEQAVRDAAYAIESGDSDQAVARTLRVALAALEVAA